jgi:hypothetical protein
VTTVAPTARARALPCPARSRASWNASRLHGPAQRHRMRGRRSLPGAFTDQGPHARDGSNPSYFRSHRAPHYRHQATQGKDGCRSLPNSDQAMGSPFSVGAVSAPGRQRPSRDGTRREKKMNPARLVRHCPDGHLNVSDVIWDIEAEPPRAMAGRATLMCILRIDACTKPQ